MKRENVYKILHSIFRSVFDDNSIQLSDETTSDDIEDWDSLENINLVSAIEKDFNIRFEIKEISSFRNVGQMVDCIVEKMNGE